MDDAQPPNEPKYVTPKKNDKVEYYDDETNTWLTVTIVSKIKRYQGWFNVKYSNQTKGSVKLTEDSLWRFEYDAKN